MTMAGSAFGSRQSGQRLAPGNGADSRQVAENRPFTGFTYNEGLCGRGIGRSYVRFSCFVKAVASVEGAVGGFTGQRSPAQADDGTQANTPVRPSNGN